MPEQRYNQRKVAEYRVSVTELHELSTHVEQQIDYAFENGSNQAVRDALAELSVSGVELE